MADIDIAIAPPDAVERLRDLAEKQAASRCRLWELAAAAAAAATAPVPHAAELLRSLTGVERIEAGAALLSLADAMVDTAKWEIEPHWVKGEEGGEYNGRLRPRCPPAALALFKLALELSAPASSCRSEALKRVLTHGSPKEELRGHELFALEATPDDERKELLEQLKKGVKTVAGHEGVYFNYAPLLHDMKNSTGAFQNESSGGGGDSGSSDVAAVSTPAKYLSSRARALASSDAELLSPESEAARMLAIARSPPRAPPDELAAALGLGSMGILGTWNVWGMTVFASGPPEPAPAEPQGGGDGEEVSGSEDGEEGEVGEDAAATDLTGKSIARVDLNAKSKVDVLCQLVAAEGWSACALQEVPLSNTLHELLQRRATMRTWSTATSVATGRGFSGRQEAAFFAWDELQWKHAGGPYVYGATSSSAPNAFARAPAVLFLRSRTFPEHVLALVSSHLKACAAVKKGGWSAACEAPGDSSVSGGSGGSDSAAVPAATPPIPLSPSPLPPYQPASDPLAATRAEARALGELVEPWVRELVAHRTELAGAAVAIAFVGDFNLAPPGHEEDKRTSPQGAWDVLAGAGYTCCLGSGNHYSNITEFSRKEQGGKEYDGVWASVPWGGAGTGCVAHVVQVTSPEYTLGKLACDARALLCSLRGVELVSPAVLTLREACTKGCMNLFRRFRAGCSDHKPLTFRIAAPALTAGAESCLVDGVQRELAGELAAE